MSDRLISVSEYAKLHGVKERAVRSAAGRIPGAYRVGRAWVIPKDAPYPEDGRVKSGKYVGKRKPRD